MLSARRHIVSRPLLRFLLPLSCSCLVDLFVSLLCLREPCRSLWMICSLRSSAPVGLYLWLSSTFSTCWMSRPCSTTSLTRKPSTSGRPTGHWSSSSNSSSQIVRLCDWVGNFQTHGSTSSRSLRKSCAGTACPHRTLDGSVLLCSDVKIQWKKELQLHWTCKILQYFGRSKHDGSFGNHSFAIHFPFWCSGVFGNVWTTSQKETPTPSLPSLFVELI